MSSPPSSHRPRGSGAAAGEVKSEPPAAERGEAGGTSSKFKGVHWDKTKAKWVGYIHMRGKKHHLGYFTDQHSAARAYDIESLKCRGYTKNFPCTEYTPQQIAEAPDGRKGLEKSSRYTGVSWNKLRKKWAARIIVDGRSQHLGHFGDEADAARAYDRVSLASRGTTKNFPAESYSAPLDSPQYSSAHAGYQQGAPSNVPMVPMSLLTEAKHLHMTLSQHLPVGMRDVLSQDNSNGSDASLDSDETCMVPDRHLLPHDDNVRIHLPGDFHALSQHSLDQYPSSSSLASIHSNMPPLSSYLQTSPPRAMSSNQHWITSDFSALSSVAPPTGQPASFSAVSNLLPLPLCGTHPQNLHGAAPLFMPQCPQQFQACHQGALASKSFPFAPGGQSGLAGFPVPYSQMPDGPMSGMLHLHHLGGSGSSAVFGNSPAAATAQTQMSQLQALAALKTTVLPPGSAMYITDREADVHQGSALKRARLDAACMASS